VKSRAHLLFLVAAFLVLPCAAQTGTVTFYSYAPTVKQQFKAMATRVGTGAFTGWLYDGDKKMAHVSRGRFMTFQLVSGGHQFSISYKSKRPSDTSLHLDVEPGRHYCVRLSAKFVGLDPGALVGIVNGKIEQMACSQAVQEAGDYKRIELKRVDSAFQAEFDASLTFPQGN
jgi:hypothetical protein